MPSPNYSNNVFINCPFDSNYKPLFNALLFTILDCGFIPRCAFEDSNAGLIRMQKLIAIMADCRYGIHDISRADLDPTTNLARFNMPFELGIYSGLIYSGAVQHKKKELMILDSHANRYDQFISDISGQDISVHNDSPQTISAKCRNWLMQTSKRVTIPSAVIIWARYNKFLHELPGICAALHWDSNDLTYHELLTVTDAWIRVNLIP